MRKFLYLFVFMCAFTDAHSQDKSADTIRYDNKLSANSDYSIHKPWTKNTLTYKFLNTTPDIADESEKDAIRRAFDLWQEKSSLTFNEKHLEKLTF